jgi:hypothetical protein
MDSIRSELPRAVSLGSGEAVNELPEKTTLRVILGSDLLVLV